MGSVAERDDKSKDTGRSGGKDGRAQAVQTLAERAEAADLTANKADFRAKKIAARRYYLVTRDRPAGTGDSPKGAHCPPAAEATGLTGEKDRPARRVRPCWDGRLSRGREVGKSIGLSSRASCRQDFSFFWWPGSSSESRAVALSALAGAPVEGGAHRGDACWDSVPGGGNGMGCADIAAEEQAGSGGLRRGQEREQGPHGHSGIYPPNDALTGGPGGQPWGRKSESGWCPWAI